jgi:hypothetical protein
MYQIRILNKRNLGIYYDPNVWMYLANRELRRLHFYPMNTSKSYLTPGVETAVSNKLIITL